ncbi:MAG TPA: hypothetical protein VKB64_04660 [Gaiellaceae bacterium]|nr:hypothetical protein [Gaiellaceae bacterium]
MLALTATAFVVTQHLKLEPSPISQTHVDKVFSPVCNCATNVAHIDFSIRRADHLRIWVRTPSGPAVIADREFPKGMVHVTWDGQGVADGVYYAVVRMSRAQRTIDLPNPIRVDTQPPTITLAGIQHDGAKTTFLYRTSEPAHALLYVNGRRRVRTYSTRRHGRLPYYRPLSPTTTLALRARDLAGNLSQLVPISGT